MKKKKKQKRLPQPKAYLTALKPYSPGKPIEEVKRELGLRRVLKLASNENMLGPSPKALAALSQRAAHLYEYPESSSYALREMLATKLKIKPTELVFGAGSDEVIHLIGLAYLEPKHEVITCAPSFVIYETTTALFGAKLIRVPLKDYTFDLKGILKRANRKTKIVFIANPNNPTGTIVSHKELRSFLQALPSHILVVLDEAYLEYVSHSKYPKSLTLFRKYPLLVLRTFSKIYGLAGLRIGYGIGQPSIIANLEKVREPFNVNRAAQVAAQAALADRSHLSRSQRLVWQERERIAQSLRELGCQVVPSQANFLFFDTGLDSRRLFTKLLQRGVIVRTGDVFGTPTFMRVTIGKPEQNNFFLRQLKAVLKEVK